MKKYLPNVITSARIIGSICLLFADISVNIFSPFWIIYLLCGISDMIDGYIARKLNAATKFGADLDSVADLSFCVCCFYRLFPTFTFSHWVWACVVVIVLIKVTNLISALVIHRKLVFPHTIANKLTGLLLFVSIPIYICFNLFVPLLIVAVVALFAAIQEGCYIRKK